MEIVHLKASHPDYKKFKQKQQQLCWITNPYMFFGIEDEDGLVRVNIPEVEMRAIKKMIEDDMEKMIDNYQFLPPGIAEAINKLEEENIDDGELDPFSTWYETD